MISVGLGYLDSHVVSTKFVIDIDFLSSFCAISNHTVTGSINVTYFRCKFSFFPFLLMKHCPIRSTYILFHGIYSANLAGNLPYFYLIILYVGKCHNYLLPSVYNFSCRDSTNVGSSLPPFYLFLYEVDTYGTNVICNFGVLTE